MARPIRVLLIEDQETDYLLTRRILARSENQTFDLHWADSWQAGIEAIRRCVHDVCLLDFRVAGGDGLELLKESRDIGCKAPVIVLTGISDYRLDLEAMELGAADFLVKDKITPELLERSIRYSIAQAQAIHQLHRQQDDLRASELRFRSVVQSAGDAIILSNDTGNIVFWNKGAETIFGYTENEIVGAPIETLMTRKYRPEYRAGFERFRVTGRSQIIGKTVELDGLRKDGAAFPLELSLASWTNGEGTMFTAIIRDVTERRRAEESRRVKEAADETSSAKSAFVARMSHERMDVHLESVSLDVVVRDVVKQLDDERRSPDVQILLQLPPSVRPIQADGQKIKQVILNIVDNALKFTKQGAVTIELTSRPGSDEPARIDVSDTGVGIPSDRIEEIFEPFRRLETDSNILGGSGLGLSICRSLCDLMGYQLQVHSDFGRGSTFSVLFGGNQLPLTA